MRKKILLNAFLINEKYALFKNKSDYDKFESFYSLKPCNKKPFTEEGFFYKTNYKTIYNYCNNLCLIEELFNRDVVIDCTLTYYEMNDIKGISICINKIANKKC